jgi:hypothetical protein
LPPVRGRWGDAGAGQLPELGRRVERLFRDCQVLDAAALVAPAFVAAAVHRDAQQAIEVGGRRLVVRRGSAVEPEVLLPLASVEGDGTGELFPSDGNDLLCLAVEAVAGGVGAHGAARRRNRPGRLATAWAVLAGADVRLRAMAAPSVQDIAGSATWCSDLDAYHNPAAVAARIDRIRPDDGRTLRRLGSTSTAS